jgi:hypothetical protein
MSVSARALRVVPAASVASARVVHGGQSALLRILLKLPAQQGSGIRDQVEQLQCSACRSGGHQLTVSGVLKAKIEPDLLAGSSPITGKSLQRNLRSSYCANLSAGTELAAPFRDACCILHPSTTVPAAKGWATIVRVPTIRTHSSRVYPRRFP